MSGELTFDSHDSSFSGAWLSHMRNVAGDQMRSQQQEGVWNIQATSGAWLEHAGGRK